MFTIRIYYDILKKIAHFVANTFHQRRWRVQVFKKKRFAYLRNSICVRLVNIRSNGEKM